MSQNADLTNWTLRDGPFCNRKVSICKSEHLLCCSWGLEKPEYDRKLVWQKWNRRRRRLRPEKLPRLSMRYCDCVQLCSFLGWAGCEHWLVAFRAHLLQNSVTKNFISLFMPLIGLQILCCPTWVWLRPGHLEYRRHEFVQILTWPCSNYVTLSKLVSLCKLWFTC